MVMLNQFGDPVTFLIDDDLRLLLDPPGVPDGGPWTPDGDLAGVWSEILAGLRGGTR